MGGGVVDCAGAGARSLGRGFGGGSVAEGSFVRVGISVGRFDGQDCVPELVRRGGITGFVPPSVDRRVLDAEGGVGEPAWLGSLA